MHIAKREVLLPLKCEKMEFPFCDKKLSFPLRNVEMKILDKGHMSKWSIYKEN